MAVAVVPGLVTDVAAVCAAVLAVAAVAALAGRGLRHVIRDEIPKALAEAAPIATRTMVRDEVTRALEPFAAELRAELRPNGGSSFSDRLNVRLDTLEENQAELLEIVTAPSILTPDPERKTQQ